MLYLSPSGFAPLAERKLLPAVEAAARELSLGSARSIVEHVLRRGDELAARIERELDDFSMEPDFRRVVARHAEAAGRALFESRPELADERVCGAAAIYAAGEAAWRAPRGSSWAWRTPNSLSQISVSTHGDVSFMQHKFSDEGLLFPELVASQVDSRGFCLSQDATPLLVTLLRYARAIGAERSPIIIDYADVIRAERANAWGMPDFSKDRRSDWDSFDDALMRDPLAVSSAEAGSYLHLHFVSAQRQGVFPALLNERLIFLAESSGGEARPADAPDRCLRQVASLGPGELEDALRGAYRSFARSPNKMVNVLERFVGGS